MPSWAIIGRGEKYRRKRCPTRHRLVPTDATESSWTCFSDVALGPSTIGTHRVTRMTSMRAYSRCKRRRQRDARNAPGQKGWRWTRGDGRSLAQGVRRCLRRSESRGGIRSCDVDEIIDVQAREDRIEHKACNCIANYFPLEENSHWSTRGWRAHLGYVTLRVAAENLDVVAGNATWAIIGDGRPDRRL